MLLFFHAVILLAWAIAGASARGGAAFRVGRNVKPSRLFKPSVNKVTTNVLLLQKGGASSQSSEYLTAIRQGKGVNGLYSRVKVCRCT